MDSSGPGPAHRPLTALGEAAVEGGPEHSLRGGPHWEGRLLRPHTGPARDIGGRALGPLVTDSQGCEALKRQGVGTGLWLSAVRLGRSSIVTQFLAGLIGLHRESAPGL